jgi:GNAT superfamily N-acetyltransferase
MAPTTVRGSSAGSTDALLLADGTRLQLRPLGSEDRDGVAALFVRLSPESRYRRFLTPKRELTPRELSYLTDIDHVHHEAFAAIDQRDGAVVGVGRYVHVADRPKVAELAVEVTDELQSMGIGTALARHTVQRARDNGFALLTATTLWENRPARALLRRLEFYVCARDGSEIELELKLDAPSDGPEDTPAIERAEPRNVFRVNQNIRPCAGDKKGPPRRQWPPARPPVSITNQPRGGAQCRSSTSS